jgi:hypothetical protein
MKEWTEREQALRELECAEELTPEGNTPAEEERYSHFLLASAIVHALLAIADAIDDSETR